MQRTSNWASYIFHGDTFVDSNESVVQWHEREQSFSSVGRQSMWRAKTNFCDAIHQCDKWVTEMHVLASSKSTRLCYFNNWNVTIFGILLKLEFCSKPNGYFMGKYRVCRHFTCIDLTLTRARGKTIKPLKKAKL